jgi:phytoene desaturase
MKPYIVIGAGFGGLAAAVRLRAMGHPVLVLEGNDQAGGRAAVWKRDGFTFDAGPTVITAPYLLDELFTLLGRDPRDYYTLEAVDPFYRVMFPEGGHFDYVGDDERLLAQIEAMSPRDVDGYRALLKQAQEIFDVGYTKLADQPFGQLSDMLRVVPDMIKLGSWRSVYGMVAKHIKDDRLRQVLTFEPLLIGGNPFTAPAIYLLIHWLERKWGVWFPKGGTGAVVNALVQLLADSQVEVRCNTPVTKIRVENGQAVGVELADGQFIAAAGVVCNGDPSYTYTNLIDAQHRKTWTDRKVAKVHQSMSLMVTYFGTEGVWPELAHHTIVLGPRYEGLLDDIFHKRVLAEDMSLYIHAPTRTDASLAPEGKECFYVLSPVPNQLSGINWEDRAAEYEDRILTNLEQRMLPGLKSRITTKFSVDPRYFTDRLNAVHGAAFGPEPRLTQSAWFRYHNASEDVGGLYFVGAGTHPGAGVPGVLNSAKVLERLVAPPEHALPVLRSVA